jgi:hypothetical protein
LQGGFFTVPVVVPVLVGGGGVDSPQSGVPGGHMGLPAVDFGAQLGCEGAVDAEAEGSAVVGCAKVVGSSNPFAVPGGATVVVAVEAFGSDESSGAAVGLGSGPFPDFSEVGAARSRQPSGSSVARAKPRSTGASDTTEATERATGRNRAIVPTLSRPGTQPRGGVRRSHKMHYVN